MGKSGKKYIKIFSIEPLLEQEKTNEEYWQKACGIPESQVTYEKYIVRESFKKFQNIVAGDFHQNQFYAGTWGDAGRDS